MVQIVSVPKELSHQRLDIVLGALFDISRQRVKSVFLHQPPAIYLLHDPFRRILSLDSKLPAEAMIVIPEYWLSILHTPRAQTDEPEAIPLSVIHEDDSFLVINKPAGIVMHPGAGCPNGTILNALLYHYPAQKALPRAGIVHRLDKDTTGLCVVARTQQSFDNLSDQLQKRTVKRRYTAFAYGQVRHQTIEKPIGRDPHHRTRMTVHPRGRYAKTTVHCHHFYERLNISHIDCLLDTGRTHQIRVHLHNIGHALVGDPVYQNKNRQGLAQSNNRYIKPMAQPALSRQALHARALTFEHPLTQEDCSYKIPLPMDMQEILDILNQSINSSHENHPSDFPRPL